MVSARRFDTILLGWYLLILGDLNVSPATRILHESLLRLFKGAVKAWEEWLKKQ